MKSNINFSIRTYWFKAAITFLTCILFLSLPSCEEKNIPAEILIGTWFMESAHSIEFTYGEKTDDRIETYDPYQCTILFQKDGTGKEYREEGYSYLFSEDAFSWGINENTLEFAIKDENGQMANLSVPFTVSENVLTLQVNSDENLVCWEESMDGGMYLRCKTVRYKTSFILSR